MENKNDNLRFGYISLYRSIMDHWIWKDPSYLKAWVGILMACNHAKNKVPISGKVYECEVGQSLNSVATWAQMFGKGWNDGRVRRFFKMLEKEGMIHTQGLSKTTRLTVCNYGSYQGKQQANGKQTTNKQQTDGEQTTTNNNDNNYNNDNNGNNNPPAGAKAPRSPRPSKATPEGETHRQAIDLYSVFIKERTLLDPDLSPKALAGLKRILTHLRKNVPAESENKEAEVLNAFQFIIGNYDKWKPYHQEQLELHQINSNKINIINAIQNHGKQLTGKSSEYATSPYRKDA